MSKYLIISIIILSFGCGFQNTLTKQEFADISDHESGIFLFANEGKVFSHFSDTTNTYSLAEKPSVPFSDFEKISKGEDNSGAFIGFKLNSEGSAKFEKLTTEYQYEKIAFVIDGFVISTPVIYMPVSRGSVQISGLSKDEADFIFRKAKAPK